MNGIRTPGVERLQDPAPLAAEDELDRSLRPKRLEDFVGQEAVKEQLAVFIEAAKARGEALDHVLLAGPPGTGQDLAGPDRGLRAGRGVRGHRRAGARAQGRRGQLSHRAGAAQRVLRGRDPPPPARAGGDVLSRDGGPPAADHRRPGRGRPDRHARPSAVHDDRRHHARGAPDHAAARPLRRHSPPRALRAARARRDRAPLGRHPRRGDRRRGRRGRSPRAPAARRGWPTGCSSAPATSPRSAERAASTPWWPARRSTCSRWTRPASTGSIARSSRRSARSSAAARSGLSTLAVAVGEEPDTIEDVYEPYLLQQGFIMRTPRGRVATDAAYGHVGVERPAGAARRLF